MHARSIADIVRVQSVRLATRRALVDSTRAWTFAELNEATSRVANGLRAAGVSPGDTVACLTRSLTACLQLAVGAAKAGAIATPINWRLQAAEVDHAVSLVRPKVLVMDRAFAAGLEVLALGERMTVLTVDGDDQSTEFASWLARQEPSDPGARAEPVDAAVRLFSSGTTGRSKAVTVTHGGILAHIEHWTGPFGFQGVETVHLNVLPTFHVSGLVNVLWVLGIGGTVVTRPQFDPADFLATIERHAVTDTFVVPTMLGALIEVEGFAAADLSSLRCIAYGGSPISQELLLRSLRALPCSLRQVYGMTELSGCISLLQPEDHQRGLLEPNILRSAGRPGSHIDVRIVDPRTGQECGEGEAGEIWVRSCQNFEDYFENPAATAEAYPQGRPGWFRTGDAGHLSAGLLHVSDRIKDMIITGGENVYPVEVEQALAAHPAVRDVAVIGIADAKWGESVRACVVLHSDRTASEAELIAFARQAIAHYKCPKSVVFLDAIPRNPSGKILKTVLRERYG